MSDYIPPQSPASVAYQLMQDLLYADKKPLNNGATRQDIMHAYREAMTETMRGK